MLSSALKRIVFVVVLDTIAPSSEIFVSYQLITNVSY